MDQCCEQGVFRNCGVKTPLMFFLGAWRVHSDAFGQVGKLPTAFPPVKVLTGSSFRMHLGHPSPSTLWAQAHDSHLDTWAKTGGCTGTCSGDRISSCCQHSLQLPHCCTEKTILLSLLIRPLGTLCKGDIFS